MIISHKSLAAVRLLRFGFVERETPGADGARILSAHDIKKDVQFQSGVHNIHTLHALRVFSLPQAHHLPVRATSFATGEHHLRSKHHFSPRHVAIVLIQNDEAAGMKHKRRANRERISAPCSCFLLNYPILRLTVSRSKA